MQENAGKTNVSSAPTDVQPYKKSAFDEYVTFCALGGLTVNETGNLKPMKLYEFCERVGVEESTTWRWKQRSDFGMLVRQRRSEIFPFARETAALNKLFLIGMTSLPGGFKEIVTERKTDKDGTVTEKFKRVPVGQLHSDQRAAVDALKTALGHDGDLRLPVQRAEVKREGNFLDMMAAAAREGIIEGEVVDADNLGPQADERGSSQDPGVLPPTS